MDSVFENFPDKAFVAWDDDPYAVAGYDTSDASIAETWEDDQNEDDPFDKLDQPDFEEDEVDILLELPASTAEWMGAAACRHTNVDYFFPPRGDLHTMNGAKEICKGCPVRLDCLEFALSLKNPARFGVWGGTSERQRRRLRRAMQYGYITQEEFLNMSHDALAAAIDGFEFPHASSLDPDQADAYMETEFFYDGAVEQPGIEVWEDQRECLRAIDYAYQCGSDRILFQLPTGRGKTTVAALAARAYLEHENPEGRVAFICHNQYILRQALDRFRHIFGNDRGYGMFVGGSDKTWEEVDFLFTTFQTMQRHRHHFDPHTFDFIVVDESHHAAAETYEPTIDYFTPDLYLAMTATVDRMDLLDIREIFGTEVYTESLIDAFAKGLLAMPHYKVMVSENEEKFWKENKYKGITKHQLNSRVFIPERDRQMIAIAQEEIKQSGIETPRILGFTDSIEHAERLADLMPGALAWHNRSREALDLFKAGRANALFTVNMANEGIDMPDINVILFFNRTESEAKFIQQLGRGARLAEGKTHFLVRDFAANCSRLFMVEDLAKSLEEKSGGRIKRSYHYHRGYEYAKPDRSRVVLNDIDAGHFIFTPAVVEILDRIKNYDEAHAIDGALGVKTFARDNGVPVPTLYKLLKRLNIELPTIDIGGRLMQGITPQIQELLRAQPEFRFVPPLPGEMSISAFAASVGISKPKIITHLKELGVDVDALPRRRHKPSLITVLDEDLQQRLKHHIGQEHDAPPPGYISLNQLKEKTGTERSTILKFVEEHGLQLIKRRSGVLVTVVFSPEQQAFLEQLPGFIVPKAPPDVLSVTASAKEINVHKRHVARAMTALGIVATEYSFQTGGRGIGVSKADRLRIKNFLAEEARAKAKRT